MEKYAQTTEQRRQVIKQVYNLEVCELSNQLVDHYYDIYYYGD